MSAASTPETEAVRDWPLWWFARLEAAVERGDHAAAAKAQRQLARLGVRVAYGLPRAKPPRTEVACDR